jgi:hypothetical protein
MLLLPLSAAAGDDPAVIAFHEPVTGITYTYPTAFQPNPELSAREAAQLSSEAADPERGARAKCLSLPLLAVKVPATPDGELGLIYLIRIDHKCLGEPADPGDLGGEAQGIAKLLLKRFGLPLTEDSLNFKLDTNPAAFVQGSAEAKILGPGRMLHAATVCTLLGQNTLCWLIFDTNHKAMPALVASTVTFAGRPPVPLVPADMVQAW